jgi:hypothetical protein
MITDELELETTKEIILLTAVEYDIPDEEWMNAIYALEDRSYEAFLSETALAFIEDIEIWASAENISHSTICAAVRGIYEE